MTFLRQLMQVKVAIVGQTGAGKTTIVNLLMKFYEIDKGKYPYRWCGYQGYEAIGSTRCLFNGLAGILGSFEGTIRDNLIYNQEGLVMSAWIEASKAVGIHHFISATTRWLRYRLGRYSDLVCRTKQLLTIARALLKDALL